jgi:hypothetical protein
VFPVPAAIEGEAMDSRVTFEDIRSSVPHSARKSARIARLTSSLGQLKAQREIIAEIQPSEVGRFDHKISEKERSLRHLTSGESKGGRK